MFLSSRLRSGFGSGFESIRPFISFAGVNPTFGGGRDLAVRICHWRPLQSQTSADWKIRKLILKIRHGKIGGSETADFFYSLKLQIPSQ